MVIIVACRREVRLHADAIVDRKAVAVLDATDVNTIISDSGVVRYRIKAKAWKIYDTSCSFRLAKVVNNNLLHFQAC